MTKADVIKQLAEELDLTQEETDQLYDSFVEGMITLLSNNRGFTLPGLGSFHAEVRTEHKSYNPHYQQMMKIPPKKVVHFKQSSVLRDELNEGEDEQ
ncbi:HU family DNA-binding protein [Gracilimonas mengyeensis]|uniref:DNA-binding protein HU-beta n=1 Tax=Gracilimonas mengyeensis TaxID=1302730 RepID=A0A521DDX5_9BACT|nr:HU family DNA-binding protein [Gracilimonas mengyeensis]SMO69927.1 DNA-binding protein HU-beta [Gracilimonas mengyeensis]